MIVPFVRKGVCAATITGTGDPRGYFFEQVQFFKGLVSTLNVFVQLSFALLWKYFRMVAGDLDTCGPCLCSWSCSYWGLKPVCLSTSRRTFPEGVSDEACAGAMMKLTCVGCGETPRLKKDRCSLEPVLHAWCSVIMGWVPEEEPIVCKCCHKALGAYYKPSDGLRLSTRIFCRRAIAG